MSKVIKLKQSDIEKIVSNIISEQEIGDEIPDSVSHEEEIDEDMTGGDVDVYPAKDAGGNLFLVNARTGEIVAKD
jgi:hypothetical protein